MMAKNQPELAHKLSEKYKNKTNKNLMRKFDIANEQKTKELNDSNIIGAYDGVWLNLQTANRSRG